jgi:hypothetical protein
MTGSVVMMPYQVYQLYQAERTKTAAEIRRADEQLGELSRAFSLAWQHATRPRAVLRALARAVAGFRAEYEPVRPQQCTQPHGLRRADYLTGYHASFPSGAPSAPSDRPDERAA